MSKKSEALQNVGKLTFYDLWCMEYSKPQTFEGDLIGYLSWQELAGSIIQQLTAAKA